ncbi:collagen alpha-2(I) chain-like, partial [Chamaea fasciata]|uniref:collagen alpha-2(I) chain-like n=1 Tax=Chamaea fasciata TaxID=190680 RepID=UPI00336A38AB
ADSGGAFGVLSFALGCARPNGPALAGGLGGSHSRWLRRRLPPEAFAGPPDEPPRTGGGRKLTRINPTNPEIPGNRREFPEFPRNFPKFPGIHPKFSRQGSGPRGLGGGALGEGRGQRSPRDPPPRLDTPPPLTLLIPLGHAPSPGHAPLAGHTPSSNTSHSLGHAPSSSPSPDPAPSGHTPSSNSSSSDPSPSPGHAPFRGSRLHLHGAFAGGEGPDLALLQLRPSPTWGPHLRPLCLPYLGHLGTPGRTCWTLVTGPAQAGSVQVRPRPCPESARNEPKSFCLEGGGEHLCQVPPGSPLFCEERGLWFLLGVARGAGGRGCAPQIHGPAPPGALGVGGGAGGSVRRAPPGPPGRGEGGAGGRPREFGGRRDVTGAGDLGRRRKFGGPREFGGPSDVIRPRSWGELLERHGKFRETCDVIRCRTRGGPREFGEPRDVTGPRKFGEPPQEAEFGGEPRKLGRPPRLG